MTTKIATTKRAATATRELTPAVAWPEVLNAYLLTALDGDGTRRAYRQAIEEALSSIGITSLEELDAILLGTWRAEISSRPLAPSTVALRLAALRSFLTWARTIGACRLPADVVRLTLRTPRGDVRQPYQVCAEPEVAAMLAAVTTPRDRALLAIMFGAGLRVSELVALDVADVIEDQDGAATIHVLHGKGNRSRTVPVRADVAAAVRAYLAAGARTVGQSGPLFRAHDRGAGKRARHRLTAQAVRDLVRQAADRAGIAAKTISPHSLRHTYAIRTLRYSRNVAAVSKLLGHRSIATTTRYLDHLELPELREAVPDLPSPAVPLSC